MALLLDHPAPSNRVDIKLDLPNKDAGITTSVSNHSSGIRIEHQTYSKSNLSSLLNVVLKTSSAINATKAGYLAFLICKSS